MKNDDINSIERVQGREIRGLKDSVNTLEVAVNLILKRMGVVVAREMPIPEDSLGWLHPIKYFLKEDTDEKK